MPRLAAYASARVFEGLVLKTGAWKTNGAAVFDEALAIGGHQVRHGAALPNVAM
jgi:hypothetical protein